MLESASSCRVLSARGCRMLERAGSWRVPGAGKGTACSGGTDACWVGVRAVKPVLRARRLADCS